MTPRIRWAILAAITVVTIAAATVFAVDAAARYRERQSAPSGVDVVDAAGTPPADRVVFRNTANGAGYGFVAWVPLDDPAAARAVSGEACDRVDATAVRTVCLRIERGIVTTFSATVYDAEWKVERKWPLTGIPSRTRLSDDSGLVATTAFVTGHSYATVGFSTETVIVADDGESSGSLEEFALWLDGVRVTAADRNIWGVTFVDDNTFYATAATGGRNWLVRGDLAERTLTGVRDGVECPSISPDGTRIAYKKNVATDGGTHWAVAVYSLADRTEVVLPEERSVDDQVEWLDDSTILYGMASTDTVGDADVFALSTADDSGPALFLEHAWSPAVIRG